MMLREIPNPKERSAAHVVVPPYHVLGFQLYQERFRIDNPVGEYKRLEPPLVAIKTPFTICNRPQPNEQQRRQRTQFAYIWVGKKRR